MAFVSLCKKSELREGEMSLRRAGKKRVLLVWPVGAEPRAYRGRCPHQDIPLENAVFDGTTVVCNMHKWAFDATTGRAAPPQDCELKPYALREVDDVFEVELA